MTSQILSIFNLLPAPQNSPYYSPFCRQFKRESQEALALVEKYPAVFNLLKRLYCFEYRKDFGNHRLQSFLNDHSVHSLDQIKEMYESLKEFVLKQEDTLGPKRFRKLTSGIFNVLIIYVLKLLTLENSSEQKIRSPQSLEKEKALLLPEMIPSSFRTPSSAVMQSIFLHMTLYKKSCSKYLNSFYQGVILVIYIVCNFRMGQIEAGMQRIAECRYILSNGIKTTTAPNNKGSQRNEQLPTEEDGQIFKLNGISKESLLRFCCLFEAYGHFIQQNYKKSKDLFTKIIHKSTLHFRNSDGFGINKKNARRIEVQNTTSVQIKKQSHWNGGSNDTILKIELIFSTLIMSKIYELTKNTYELHTFMLNKCIGYVKRFMENQCEMQHLLKYYLNYDKLQPKEFAVKLTRVEEKIKRVDLIEEEQKSLYINFSSNELHAHKKLIKKSQTVHHAHQANSRVGDLIKSPSFANKNGGAGGEQKHLQSRRSLLTSSNKKYLNREQLLKKQQSEREELENILIIKDKKKSYFRLRSQTLKYLNKENYKLKANIKQNTKAISQINRQKVEIENELNPSPHREEISSLLEKEKRLSSEIKASLEKHLPNIPAVKKINLYMKTFFQGKYYWHSQKVYSLVYGEIINRSQMKLIGALRRKVQRKYKESIKQLKYRGIQHQVEFIKKVDPKDMSGIDVRFYMNIYQTEKGSGGLNEMIQVSEEDYQIVKYQPFYHAFHLWVDDRALNSDANKADGKVPELSRYQYGSVEGEKQAVTAAPSAKPKVRLVRLQSFVNEILTTKAQYYVRKFIRLQLREIRLKLGTASYHRKIKLYFNYNHHAKKRSSHQKSQNKLTDFRITGSEDDGPAGRSSGCTQKPSKEKSEEQQCAMVVTLFVTINVSAESISPSDLIKCDDFYKNHYSVKDRSKGNSQQSGGCYQMNRLQSEDALKTIIKQQDSPLKEVEESSLHPSGRSINNGNKFQENQPLSSHKPPVNDISLNLDESQCQNDSHSDLVATKKRQTVITIERIDPKRYENPNYNLKFYDEFVVMGQKTKQEMISMIVGDRSGRVANKFYHRNDTQFSSSLSEFCQPQLSCSEYLTKYLSNKMTCFWKEPSSYSKILKIQSNIMRMLSHNKAKERRKCFTIKTKVMNGILYTVRLEANDRILYIQNLKFKGESHITRNIGFKDLDFLPKIKNRLEKLTSLEEHYQVIEKYLKVKHFAARIFAKSKNIRLFTDFQTQFRMKLCFSTIRDEFLFRGKKREGKMMFMLTVKEFSTFPRPYSLRVFTLDSHSIVQIDAIQTIYQKEKLFLEENLSQIQQYIEVLSKKQFQIQTKTKKVESIKKISRRLSIISNYTFQSEQQSNDSFSKKGNRVRNSNVHTNGLSSTSRIKLKNQSNTKTDSQVSGSAYGSSQVRRSSIFAKIRHRAIMTPASHMEAIKRLVEETKEEKQESDDEEEWSSSRKNSSFDGCESKSSVDLDASSDSSDQNALSPEKGIKAARDSRNRFPMIGQRDSQASQSQRVTSTSHCSQSSSSDSCSSFFEKPRMSTILRQSPRGNEAKELQQKSKKRSIVFEQSNESSEAMEEENEIGQI